MLDKLVTRPVGLPVHQLHQHHPLRRGHVAEVFLIFAEKFLLKLPPPLATLLFILNKSKLRIRILHVFHNHLGVWQRLFHVAHRPPVEILLLLVLETQLREHMHIVQTHQQHRVAALHLHAQVLSARRMHVRRWLRRYAATD